MKELKLEELEAVCGGGFRTTQVGGFFTKSGGSSTDWFDRPNYGSGEDGNGDDNDDNDNGSLDPDYPPDSKNGTM